MSQNKRYFAFGCSYVHYGWATTADLIAANFDKYYNYGVSGSCNSYILSRVIEANDTHQFCEEDFVTVGITGYGRFNFLDKANPNHWVTSGDTIPPDPRKTIEEYAPSHDWRAKLFASQLDSYAWCVQRSYVSIQSILNILQNTKVKYTIYPAIDNFLFTQNFKKDTNYQDYFNLTESYQNLAKKILDLCTVKESVDEFIRKNKLARGVKYLNGEFSGHPNQSNHYDYLKTHFLEFDTDKTKDRYNFVESIFCNQSHIEQSLDFGEKFSEVYKEKVPTFYYD